MKGPPSYKVVDIGRIWRNPDSIIEFSRRVVKGRLHVCFREPFGRRQIPGVDRLLFRQDRKYPGENEQAYERTLKETG